MENSERFLNRLAYERAVLVTVESLRGSAPREQGAWMAVFVKGTVGIIAALQVLAALRREKQTLPQASADLTLYPQKLINVRMAAGFDWKSDESIAQAVKAAEAALDGSGRVLLRPSGTEPLLRVMVEGRDGVLVNAQAEAIAGAVRNAVGA